MYACNRSTMSLSGYFFMSFRAPGTEFHHIDRDRVIFLGHPGHPGLNGANGAEPAKKKSGCSAWKVKVYQGPE